MNLKQICSNPDTVNGFQEISQRTFQGFERPKTKIIEREMLILKSITLSLYSFIHHLIAAKES